MPQAPLSRYAMYRTLLAVAQWNLLVPFSLGHTSNVRYIAFSMRTLALLLRIAFGLLGDEFLVLEVVDAHGVAHFGQGLRAYAACFLGAAFEDFVDGGNILLVLLAALADGFKAVVEHVEEELLARAVAQAAALVVGLHFIQILVVRQELLEIAVLAEGIEIDEYGVLVFVFLALGIGIDAAEVAGVFNIQVERVGKHTVDLLLEFLGRVGQVDAVAQRLGHLRLAVRAGQAETGAVVGQHNLGLHEGFAVDMIEAAYNFVGEFEHRLLVLADGHGGCLEQGDVGCLRDGIAEEACGCAAFKLAHFQLGLDGRIALEALHADEVEIVEGQFRQFGHGTLNEDVRLLGVEARREVVEGHLNDVLTNLLGIIGVVREGLSIGNHHENLVELARVLQFHTAAERAYVVADMQSASRTVASQYNFLFTHGLYYFVGFCGMQI